MLRTTFLIDGFNLYHSLRQAERDLAGMGTKWLDIHALCEQHLYIIDTTARLSGIHYFSALASHLEASNPEVTARHRHYLSCLEDTGVNVELAHFKRKQIYCSHCNGVNVRFEEKETDVAIAIRLFELFHGNLCDVAVLVTGDTDIAPAARRVRAVFPDSEIWFGFPYARKSKELETLAGGKSFKFSKESYRRHQLRDPYLCANGSVIPKPAGW